MIIDGDVRCISRINELKLNLNSICSFLEISPQYNISASAAYVPPFIITIDASNYAIGSVLSQGKVPHDLLIGMQAAL